MKYCLQYSNICKKFNLADEVMINYIEDKGLLTFLERHAHQRVNLLTEQLPISEVRKLIAIKTDYPQYNFVVVYRTHLDAEMTTVLQANNIPFYCAAPCLSWETFHYLVKAGVSDVNVSGPLAFALPKVKRVLEKLGAKIQLRATPNFCLKEHPTTEGLIGFFIRPEDTEKYEGYIDIFDFYGVEHQDTFYNLYTNQHFLGNLNTIIYHLNMDIDNKAMVTLFGERRLGCDRECLKGGRCHRCYDLYKLEEIYRVQAQEQIEKTFNEARQK